MPPCAVVVLTHACNCPGWTPTASLVLSTGLRPGASKAFTHAPEDEELYVEAAKEPSRAVEEARKARRIERAAAQRQRQAALAEFRADREDLADRSRS